MAGEPILVWGVKTSLLQYVEALEDGLIETSAPAVRDGSNFSFAYDLSGSIFEGDLLECVLQFRGVVVMTAYWGTMQIEIKDPRLTLAGGAGDLAVRTNSALFPDRFESIATVNVVTLEPELECEVRLSAAGRMLLGQQYQVGQELNCLTVITQENSVNPHGVEG